MVRLVTVCSMICVLEIKRCQTFRVLKGATYVVFFFKILIALMFLCTCIVLNAISCVTFSVIFATRASIVCIDSGTCDTIRVSFALTIRFFDISINRYTPNWWIQTGVTVRKRPIWVKFDDFSSRVTLKFDGWPWKTIGHLYYTTSSSMHHFVAIGEFKLEVQSGNAQFGSKSTIFRAVWPCNLTDDLAKQ